MILGSVKPSSVCAARVLPSRVASRPAISVVQQWHPINKWARAAKSITRISIYLSMSNDGRSLLAQTPIPKLQRARCGRNGLSARLHVCWLSHSPRGLRALRGVLMRLESR